MAEIARRPPGSLEAFDVGDPDDGWVLVRFDAVDPSLEGLTPALADVLAGIVRGETNAAIARRRGTSIRTVDNQIADLMERFSARSRVDLVRRVLEEKARAPHVRRPR